MLGIHIITYTRDPSSRPSPILHVKAPSSVALSVTPNERTLSYDPENDTKAGPVSRDPSFGRILFLSRTTWGLARTSIYLGTTI